MISFARIWLSQINMANQGEGNLNTNANHSNTNQVNQNQNAEICRVAARIPPFNPGRPDLWFTQIESQFIVAGITQEDTKYHIVVGHIDSKAVEPIADLITNPPTINKYTTLKTRLIAEFQDSDQKRLKNLIMDIELGDLRPTQLLKKMKELAGTSMTDDVVKSLWLQRLPNNVRAIVSTIPGDSSQMATVADKIFEVSDVGTISEATYDRKEKTTTIDRMQQQIDELTKKLAKFEHRRDRSRSKENIRSKSKQREFENCWYHFRYGERATKCREPCNYKNKSEN